MALTSPFWEDFDWYQQTHPFAPFVVLTTAIAMCTVLYPKSKDGSCSHGDAVQIVAVLTGVSIGSWLNFHFQFTSTSDHTGPYDVIIPSVRDLAMQILRFFVGVVIIGLLKVTLKEITVRLFSKLYGLKVPNQEHPSVKLAYKFAVYGVMGFRLFFSCHLFTVCLDLSGSRTLKKLSDAKGTVFVVYFHIFHFQTLLTHWNKLILNVWFKLNTEDQGKLFL